MVDILNVKDERRGIQADFRFWPSEVPGWSFHQLRREVAKGADWLGKWKISVGLVCVRHCDIPRADSRVAGH